MKAKRYWIVAFLVVGIFVAETVWAPVRRPKVQTEQQSLAGLKGIKVSVLYLNQVAEKYRTIIQPLLVQKSGVELQLRHNGINVLPEEQELRTRQAPYLNVGIALLRAGEADEAGRELVACYIEVAFEQVVSLQRDRRIICYGDTWRNHMIITTSTDRLEKEVETTIQALLNMFINDYLAANPKEQKGTKEQSSRDRGTKASERIEAKVGQDFVITLGTNPTTGYSWRLAEPLPSMLKLQSKKYIPAKVQKIGGGGTEEWIFKSVSSGKVTIMFEYVRPWEKNSPPAKQRIFSIVAK